MANSKNLKPLSSSEARKIGKKGGIISGKKRAERKRLKEELKMLLEEGNTQERMCLSLIDKAISGDVRAFETIRDTIGEKNPSDFDFDFSPLIVDDINPFEELTTEELRRLIKEENEAE